MNTRSIVNYLINRAIYFLLLTVVIPNSITCQGNAITLKFSKIEIVYNDHVGNEWDYYIRVNKSLLYEGESIQIKNTNENKELKILCFLAETNEKHIDTAENSKTYKFDQLIGMRNSIVDIPVKIQEKNGRYAGNYAVINFIISIY